MPFAMMGSISVIAGHKEALRQDLDLVVASMLAHPRRALFSAGLSETSGGRARRCPHADRNLANQPPGPQKLAVPLFMVFPSSLRLAP